MHGIRNIHVAFTDRIGALWVDQPKMKSSPKAHSAAPSRATASEKKQNSLIHDEVSSIAKLMS